MTIPEKSTMVLTGSNGPMIIQWLLWLLTADPDPPSHRVEENDQRWQPHALSSTIAAMMC